MAKLTPIGLGVAAYHATRGHERTRAGDSLSALDKIVDTDPRATVEEQ